MLACKLVGPHLIRCFLAVGAVREQYKCTRPAAATHLRGVTVGSLLLFSVLCCGCLGKGNPALPATCVDRPVFPLSYYRTHAQALPSLAEVMYSQFKSKKESLTKQNKEDVIAKYGNEGVTPTQSALCAVQPLAALRLRLVAHAGLLQTSCLPTDVLPCPALPLLLVRACSCPTPRPDAAAGPVGGVC